MIKKFFTYLIYHPERILLRIWNCIAPLISDRLFLAVKFRLTMGYWMDFDDPKTYNEKLQWLKLHDRRPEYTQMVDKAGVKDYVAQRIGEQYIIPTIGIWDRPEDIPWDELPNQFVAKVTHDSGGIIICKDKSKLNTKNAIKKLSHALMHDYYYISREWPYKDVKRRIIVEQYKVDESGYELKDYKFFCFGGEPRFFKVDFGRFKDHHANYYDTNWHLLPFDEVTYPRIEHASIAKPVNFEKMVAIAKILSKEIPFVRVDLYNINGKIYFGELTFYPTSGIVPFEPQEWDYKIGEWIRLDNIYEK